MIKKHILLLFFCLIGTSALKAQGEYGSCEDWYVVPYLYNDSISDNSEICYWVNYWNEPDTTISPFFPDTLIICLHLIPSTIIWEKSLDAMESYRIKSNLIYVMGSSGDSYNVVNPKMSDPYQLFDSIIDFESAFNYIEQNNVGFIIISRIKIPLKEYLRSLNVYMNIIGETANLKENPLIILNRINIQTFFYSKENELCRQFDYVLPVNGPYCRGEKF